MREIKDITLEGAYRLAAAILIDAHDSYISSLKIISKHRDEMANGLKEKCETYIDWLHKKKKYVAIMKKIPNKRTSCEKQFAKEFRETPPPPACSTRDIRICQLYISAEREKKQCELFYKSRQFQLYCGGEFTGEEIIERLKEEANYNYAD